MYYIEIPFLQIRRKHKEFNITSMSKLKGNILEIILITIIHVNYSR